MKISPMDRHKKIELLQRIESGELSPNILIIEPGLYLRTDEPNIYYIEKGYKLKYPDIIQQSKILSLLCEITNITGENTPAFIRVIPFPVGWIEEKEYTSIELPTKETAQAMEEFWNME
jgi:hypothetical protein